MIRKHFLNVVIRCSVRGQVVKPNQVWRPLPGLPHAPLAEHKKSSPRYQRFFPSQSINAASGQKHSSSCFYYQGWQFETLLSRIFSRKDFRAIAVIIIISIGIFSKPIWWSVIMLVKLFPLSISPILPSHTQTCLHQEMVHW